MVVISFASFCDYLSELLLETLDTADFSAFDALVYCIGSLKFLSGNTTTLKYMVKHHALKQLAKLLAAINTYVSKAAAPNTAVNFCYGSW